ncbi:hypothetical protein [Ammoniphilus sp. YIM 78166]|uniref:hypothetical protein n=1 Tax=Ammoniphilus sp. YIM 78166 TaxID=1644106 RepID=UPI00106F773C|nr:hypothetical protein [Ammoniphilus sp. YIM 78166]
MNRTKIGLGLFVLVLLWVGNLAYFQRHQLNEPLFMKHYYDIGTLGDQLNVELYYLVNHNEDVGIYNVRIPSLNHDLYPTWEHERSRSRYHKVKSVRFEWNEAMLNDLGAQEKITELEVQFSDGTRQLVDIGEILIRRIEGEDPYIHTQSSGGSSDNTGFSHFREKETLKPIRIKHLPPGLDSNVLTFRVNGQDLGGEVDPIHFDFKPYLEVNYAFKFSKDDPRAQHIYGSMSVVEVQTEDGQLKEGLMFINYTPNWSIDDIRAILDERRES